MGGNYQKKKEEIERIYREYAGKMNELKKEQDTVLEDFLGELEKEKIEEIKRNL
jgi:hypothetical protein